MLRLVCVPPNDAAAIWPLAKEFIRKATDHPSGMGDFAQTENGVLRGNDLLWLAVENDTKIIAAAVTVLIDGVCVISAMGGDDFKRFGQFCLSGLEKFAKDEGCRAVRICGRPGWVRRLAGYRLRKVIIEKAI